MYGLGRIWTDQQWGAQLLLYGLWWIGGHPLLAVADALVVVGAFALAIAGARSLGAGPRSIWVLWLPVLIAAPWAWTIRAQLLALPLYTGLLWLLASEARRPSRRVYLVFPILVLWGNLHGSAALGALFAMLLGAIELLQSRGRTWRRDVVLLVVSPLCLLVTPYSPVAMARYYRTLLVDPPFGRGVTEWMWAKPAGNTAVFYFLAVVAIALVVWGRRRLRLFDLAVLALTFVGAVSAIRGIPWFALGCMLFLPVAIGRALEGKSPPQFRRGFNVAIATGAAVTVLALVVFALARPASWYEEDWPQGTVLAVERADQPGTRVFAGDIYADWLLWKIPDLRGRLAYDVRFEIYSSEWFRRLLRYNGEAGPDWKSLADGYPIVVVDETERSHTADFLREPGARRLFHTKNVSVIARPQER